MEGLIFGISRYFIVMLFSLGHGILQKVHSTKEEYPFQDSQSIHC